MPFLPGHPFHILAQAMPKYPSTLPNATIPNKKNLAPEIVLHIYHRERTIVASRKRHMYIIPTFNNMIPRLRPASYKIVQFVGRSGPLFELASSFPSVEDLTYDFKISN